LASNLVAVVLAAGQSKRFGSPVPKVLHDVGGKPLVGHVVEALGGMRRSLRPRSAVMVVPPGGAVAAALAPSGLPFPLRFATQSPPRGTGDATRIALAAAGDCDEVLVIAGDMPLVLPATLDDLVRRRRDADAAAVVLTAIVDDAGALGRVIRSGERVERVVEAKDATPSELAIREVNTSVYVFSRRALDEALPLLSDDNAQGEYYLTDAIGMLAGSGRVIAVTGSAGEALGANTQAELAAVGAELSRRRSVHVSVPRAAYTGAVRTRKKEG
jgi:bifunctional UDP-N-acetylglucosamine pyrophosphorylase/glucosamine-1-phosphate N-acetyltransferase